MKGRIIAIGGGRMRVPAAEVETTAIDAEIVRLANRRRPRLLFIPTASEDDPEYTAAITRQFGKRFGCRVETLELIANPLSHSRTAAAIGSADIIYVGGGNTLRMMNLWRRLGVDIELDRARRRGAVLCGLSAGAICWFRQGNSDSRKFRNPRSKTLIKVTGLKFVDALCCPHYDTERHRPASLKDMMRRTPGVAIALENNAAIEIIDDSYRILASRRGKRAWRICWRGGRYCKEALDPGTDFHALAALLDPHQPLDQGGR
jgi:dipeptidase E